jgi:hypothetical protein
MFSNNLKNNELEFTPTFGTQLRSYHESIYADRDDVTYNVAAH